MFSQLPMQNSNA